MNRRYNLMKSLSVLFVLTALIISASASTSQENKEFIEPERVSPTEVQYMQEKYDRLQESLAEGNVSDSISKGCFYQVLYNNVNIRSGPGTNYPSYGLLQKGDGLYRVDFNPGVKTDSQGYKWYHLNVMTGANTGVSGWVRGDQIKLTY